MAEGTPEKTGQTTCTLPYEYPTNETCTYFLIITAERHWNEWPGSRRFTWRQRKREAWKPRETCCLSTHTGSEEVEGWGSWGGRWREAEGWGTREGTAPLFVLSKPITPPKQGCCRNLEASLSQLLMTDVLLQKDLRSIHFLKAGLVHRDLLGLSR